MPANRAGLYSMKLTQGSVPMDGVLTLTKAFDCIGAMAKCPADLELLITALAPARSIDAELKAWTDCKIGFVDPVVWEAVPVLEAQRDEVDDQITSDYERAISKLSQRGAKVSFPVELPTSKEFRYNDKSVTYTACMTNFQESIQDFISRLESSPVRTLDELVEWNTAYADRAMPAPHGDQADLIATLQTEETADTSAKAISYGRSRAREGIRECLERDDVDIIAGPGDCGICIVAALAGYPAAMVPMTVLGGEKGMGQPQGLMLIANAGHEAKIIEFMQLWESVVGSWQTPTRFRNGEVSRLTC